MGKPAVVVLHALASVAVVVGVDVLFFRHQVWERLMVNIGIVLVFAAFCLRIPEALMSKAAAMRLTRRPEPPAGFHHGSDVGQPPAWFLCSLIL